MANEPIITVTGNATSDADLRFLSNGTAVANFTLAATPRSKNKQTDEWEDGETLWLRVGCFRQMAESVAESITKGTRVIVTGRLKQRSYTTKEGVERTSLELDADEVGVSLKFATARVQKVDRRSGGGGNSDPWASAAGPDDSPPF